MSEWISNGYFVDKDGKRIEIVDAAARADVIENAERVNQLAEEINGLKQPGESDVTIDTTMTVSGAAADAASAGQRFNLLSLQMAKKAAAIHADQHRSSDTVTWDGDETGRTVVELVEDDGCVDHFVLMSDKEISIADIENGFSGEAFHADLPVYGFEKYRYESNEDGFIRFYIEHYSDLGGGRVFFMVFAFYAPTDNYTVDPWGDECYAATFPKKGLYFCKVFEEGEVIVFSKRITIPGCNFGDATDPITPGMIGAAPENHASESATYGMATPERFGHVKAQFLDGMPRMGNEDDGQDPGLWYDGYGNLIGDMSAVEEHVRGIVPNMLFMSIFYTTLYYEIEDLEMAYQELVYVFKDLRDRVTALEKGLAALKG